MFSKEMEALIEAALQDGVLTDQEKAVLVKRAQKEGIDIDELDVYIQSLLQKRHQDTAAREAEEDKQSKMGVLRKCPNCGAPIQGGWAVCPSCGFAFGETKGNSTAKELQKELAAIDKEGREEIAKCNNNDYSKRDDLKKQYIESKFTLISNTVVPNNRADLLEILAFAKPKADKFGYKRGYELNGAWVKQEDLSFAYWTLFENCVNMAKVSFADDNAFQSYFNYYDEICAQRGLWRRISKSTNTVEVVYAIVFILILIIVLIMWLTQNN